MTIVDNYFPFDQGPGATATSARWRLMARQWRGSGVIPNYLNNCNPTLAGSVVTIDTGAWWIDGFYGEIDSPKTVTITGNATIVARMDPTARQVLIAPITVPPTQTLTGIYEVPICRVTSGTLVDIRQFAGFPGLSAGLMLEHGGGAAPLGFLLCNGASYLTTDYPGLFNAIGYTWGGSGANFNVPDIRGRASVGAGAGAGLTNRVVAAKGGEETHALTSAETGNHAHGLNWNDPGHNHNAVYSHYVDYSSNLYLTPGTSGTRWSTWTAGAPITQAAVTGISASIAAAGGGQGHNTMPPFAVVLKVIKT